MAGNCIVEEAVLTGESTPQWKVPVNDAAVDPSEHLNIKVHKAHVLFGGTKILQHTGDKAAKIRTPDGGCLAIVLRTGFETSQGRLMRTILYSTERVTANSLETGLFICFLLIFAVSAAYYVLKNGLAVGQERASTAYLRDMSQQHAFGQQLFSSQPQQGAMTLLHGCFMAAYFAVCFAPATRHHGLWAFV